MTCVLFRPMLRYGYLWTTGGCMYKEQYRKIDVELFVCARDVKVSPIESCAHHLCLYEKILTMMYLQCGCCR